jgi:Xaa-Pro aminopeptidase
MKIYANQVKYTHVAPPVFELPERPADLCGAVYDLRKQRTLNAMKANGLDVIIVYADREHGSNFGYLTGFEPRFEEAVLVLHQDGSAFVLLGNETLKMHQYSRIPVSPIHTPYFSLPNQPMDGEEPLEKQFQTAGIRPGMSIGLAGWKLFTGKVPGNSAFLDIPHFIVQAVEAAGGAKETLENATGLFIHPDTGVRNTVCAEEAAQYEFAAATASCCVQRLLSKLEVGANEQELASELNIYAMPLSCYSMCATGERFTNAVVFPRDKKVELGDKFTASMGLRGGLTCRAGYVAKTADDLPERVRDFLEAVAKPYFAATATWYSTIGIGITGGELYNAVNEVTPKEKYGWKLNPGHLTAAEEWMSSPIWDGSPIKLRSGMMFQMDIIPSIPGYGGTNAEDGVMLASDELRQEIADKFPGMWRRICRRWNYMTEVLGIPLKEELLPMTDSVGYLRPLLLNQKMALKADFK